MTGPGKYRLRGTVQAVQFTKEMRESIVLDGAKPPAGVWLGRSEYHRGRREIHGAWFYVGDIGGSRCHRIDVGDWVYSYDGATWEYASDKEFCDLFAPEPVPVPADDGWQPIETAPKDGRPLLFWLEKPSQKTQVHSGFILPNISVIGGHFAFDMPRALYWRELPPPPGALGRSK